MPHLDKTGQDPLLGRDQLLFRHVVHKGKNDSSGFSNNVTFKETHRTRGSSSQNTVPNTPDLSFQVLLLVSLQRLRDVSL
jgi:hypothetical protein